MRTRRDSKSRACIVPCVKSRRFPNESIDQSNPSMGKRARLLTWLVRDATAKKITVATRDLSYNNQLL
jgi:hypothetical protein